MYLSRLVLNPRNRQVQTDIADLYQLHRTVMRGFPLGEIHLDRTTPDAAGVLYRLDSELRRGLLTLLVQSQVEPDWSALPAGYLLPPDVYDPVGENPALKPYDPHLRAQQVLHFRLLANPTKRLGKRYGAAKGKRVGLYRAEEQIEWLQRKAEQGGFRVISALPSQAQTESGTTRNTNSAHPLKLHRVRFDGQLQVLDPEGFRSTLQAGIGSGKAFGCGLLSLAPAR